MPFEAPETIIRAIFPTTNAAELAATDLRTRFGLDDDHLEVAPAPEGRHALEDELDPERSHDLRLILVAAGIAGAAIGVGLVAAAGSSGLVYLAGAFGGSFFGAVVGGVLASAWLLPDDDDPDRYLEIAPEVGTAVLTARVRATTPIHLVHRALRRDGAEYFLRMTSV